MYKVSIQDAIFQTHIGLHAEEERITNKLCINVTIGKASDIQNINFLDYSLLYNCVANAVIKNKTTLENLIQDIQHYITMEFGILDYIHIQIEKLNPPIIGNIKAAVVAWEYKK